MSPDPIHAWILASPARQALPIATYPGLALTGATVRQVVTEPAAQVEVQAALQARYHGGCVLTAMDLSAEAEAFGSAVRLSEREPPSVVGRLVTSRAQAEQLRVPLPGAGRTGVYLEAARRLGQLPGRPLVLGGCIGPFSLTARLLGVAEAMELTLADPGLVHGVLAKAAEFLARYVRAFADGGADGLIMAEPAAGLLSPRGLAAFSSVYIRRIAAELEGRRFALILHNCAAKLVHLPAVLETGLRHFHFGAPMDLPVALERVPPEVLVYGNLDPVAAFCQVTPAETGARAAALLAAAAGRWNLVLSSGCDLPPHTPLANLDAFYQALAAPRR